MTSAMNPYQLIYVVEPEGALLCNTCQRYIDDPTRHSRMVHGIADADQDSDVLTILSDELERGEGQ